MVLLHKSGVLIELGAVESVRPLTRNPTTGELTVEIVFNSGNKMKFTDSWWYKKGDKDPVSIYSMELGDSLPVDWRVNMTMGG